MKLSILTPTIPERCYQSDRFEAHSETGLLADKIESQINQAGAAGLVEHLVFCDNRRRTIGEKRQALIDIALGEYIAFVDDDDDISDDYVASLLEAIESAPDVITFQQRAIYNGQESTIHFRLESQDEVFNPGGITLRSAWHVCAWKREKVKKCLFLSCNYGEDKVWAIQARRMVRSEMHIPRIIHTYRHDAKTTAAPES